MHCQGIKAPSFLASVLDVFSSVPWGFVRCLPTNVACCFLLKAVWKGKLSLQEKEDLGLDQNMQDAPKM